MKKLILKKRKVLIFALSFLVGSAFVPSPFDLWGENFLDKVYKSKEQIELEQSQIRKGQLEQLRDESQVTGTLNKMFDTSVGGIKTTSKGSIFAFGDHKGLGVLKFDPSMKVDILFQQKMSSQVTGTVRQMHVLKDESVLLLGSFKRALWSERKKLELPSLIRINPDGEVDETFRENVLGLRADNIKAVGVWGDEGYLAYGSFPLMKSSNSLLKTLQVIKISPDGKRDSQFELDDRVRSFQASQIEYLGDGKGVLRGYFRIKERDGLIVTTTNADLLMVNSKGVADILFSKNHFKQKKRSERVTTIKVFDGKVYLTYWAERSQKFNRKHMLVAKRDWHEVGIKVLKPTGELESTLFRSDVGCDIDRKDLIEVIALTDSGVIASGRMAVRQKPSIFQDMVEDIQLSDEEVKNLKTEMESENLTQTSFQFGDIEKAIQQVDVMAQESSPILDMNVSLAILPETKRTPSSRKSFQPLELPYFRCDEKLVLWKVSPEKKRDSEFSHLKLQELERLTEGRQAASVKSDEVEIVDIALLPNGSIIVGGNFDRVRGLERTHVLILDKSGKVKD